MLRRAALLVCAATLAGCQSYNFNPVGKCIIQPGNTRLTLNAVTTADILFVIDDSGSMRTQQESLARNFGAFIDALAQEQKGRADRGLEALDFHIAITTSSVFENQPAQNAPVCSDVGAGLECRIQFPAVGEPYSYACTTPGTPCGDLIQTYYAVTPTCAAQGAALGQPFPQGNFVATPGNPRVLHFTKDLDWASWGTLAPDPRLAALVDQFRQNVQVGTCGSGQETHLEASRLAMKRALNLDGLSQVGIGSSEFPHENAKLVVVWVGDEDDCSSPGTPGTPVIMVSGAPGADSCIEDARSASPRQTPVSEYADFFTSLNRPFAAAFITSSLCTVGADGRKTCEPAQCSCTAPPGAPTPSADCSGKSAGTRLNEMSTLLTERGFQVVEDSVCEFSFAETLQAIAELVKPPSGLRLPTQPASPEVSVLRIIGRDGQTARLCNGPSPSADWWFVGCDDPTATPVEGATSCIAIRPGSACEANPGETYSAEYLGLVPEGGCGTRSTESQECSSMLGGRAADWSCDVPQGQLRGTCLCNRPE